MKTLITILKLTFILFITLQLICYAQEWQQILKICASDRSQGARFGWSVSVSGDYAIIGATGDQSNTGAAYIFKKEGDIWNEQQKLVASDGDESDLFGYSVYISGDYAIVGAVYDANNSTHTDSVFRSGSAYIFKRDGNFWNQQQKISCSNRRKKDYFGNSVSISDNYAIIGAPQKEYYYPTSDSILDAGIAYIFKRNGNIWTEHQILSAFQPQEGAWFGNAVSILGNYAVVGAYDEDINPNYIDSLSAGALYVFKLKDTIWTQSQRLVPLDLNPSDNFGNSVCLSDNYIVVGSPDHCFDTTSVVTPQAGAAYIYLREDTTWNFQQKIFEPTRYRDHHFGYSVSHSGDYVLAGSGGSFAYMFKKTSNSWYLQNTLSAFDHGNTINIGNQVSISGDYSIFGSYTNYTDTSGGNTLSQAGAAYIFKLTNGTDVELNANGELPAFFNLNQNYPNPFNPSTKISWQSPVSGWQTIKLFDVLGRELETIVEGYFDAGNHSTLYIVHSSLPSGVYFYQLKAVDPSISSGKSFIQTKKMILLK